MIELTVMVGGFIVLAGTMAGLFTLASVVSQKKILRKLESRNEAMERRLSRLESLLEEERLPGLQFEDLERPVEPFPTKEPKPGTTHRPTTHSETQPKYPPSREIQPENAKRRPDDPAGTKARVIAQTARGEPWWVGLEESVGKRWTTWGGALALFISAGFFLKYAFDNQWLGPTGRIALGILAGIILLALGDQSLRRNMRALGQGLMGGGLAILYISLFAAFSLYDIIPQMMAFAAMVVVTAAGMALAVLHNATALGFLALLGGFLTPLMVSTGHDARDSLFGYLAVLDLGVLGVAVFKRWRALDVLAFLGTWALFAGWFFKFYSAPALIPTVLWLAAFFLIFLIVPFMNQLRTGTPSTIESFSMALANAVVTFGFAYHILREDHQFTLGFVALAMAASYVLLAAVLRRRVPSDSRSLLGFVGLAVVFVTLAVPLHLRLHGITLAWAVEGPVLVYMGYLFAYRPVRIAGFVVLVLAAARLFLAHWPFHTALYTLFLNRYFAAAMFVPIAAAAYSFIHHRYKAEATNVDRYLMLASAISVGYLALIILSGEVTWWLQYQPFESRINWRYFSSCFVGAIWAVGAAAYLAAALRAKSKASYYAGLGVLIIALLSCMASYSIGRRGEYLILLNARFTAGLLTAMAAFGFAWVARGWGGLFSERDSILAKGLFAVAGLVPLALLSAEAYTYCLETISSRRRARWTGLMALSVVWGVYAVVWLAIGFWKKIWEFRIAALGLLAVVAIKVVLVDMATVKQIYRIISFVVLGLMMISASYLYHRLEQRLTDTSGDGS
jgi:uncharacterized membrane protein